MNPDKYKPHPTDHLPVWPTNANDRWDPVTGHAWPCCCQRCINLPWKNPPPIVPEPSEQDDEEYYDDDYEPREDTPTKQLIDVHKDDDKDDKDSHINAITLPTDTSTLSRCVLDSGANRHIFNNETWLEGKLPSPYSNVYSHQRHLWLHQGLPPVRNW